MEETSGKRIKKAPIGTHRTWSDGITYIKTHDNNELEDFHSCWMPLPKGATGAIRVKLEEMDKIGEKILKYIDPINGDLWMEKCLNDFTTEIGTQKSFRASDFKRYYFGNKDLPKYCFSSELSMRMILEKVKLNQKIGEELLRENEIEKFNGLNSGRGVEADGIYLSKEQIVAIKSKIRNEFKFDENEKKISEKDINKLKGELEEILNFLENGEDSLDEKSRDLLKEGREFILELRESKDYVNIDVRKEEYRSWKNKITNHFSNNWGIRESFSKDLEKSFRKYFSDWKIEIEEDEVIDFIKKTGVDLYEETKYFYERLEENLSKNTSVFDLDNLEGKIISSPYDKYKDIKITEYIKQKDLDDLGTLKYEELDNIGIEKKFYLSNEDLIKVLRRNEIPELEIPLKIRFQVLYSIGLEGGWGEDDLKFLHIFEKLANFLPKGHVVNNEFLEKVRKNEFFGDTDNGYASFSSSEKEIYISNKCVERVGRGMEINSGHEVASVLIHEIGHALSTKLGKRNDIKYKKFVRDCGWDWQQFDRKNEGSYQATGFGSPTKREGTRNNVPLITKYSERSPEEAFAEYYSFYSQYKSRIDNFIKSEGKDKHLIRVNSEIKAKPSPKKFGEHILESFNRGEEEMEWECMRAQLEDCGRSLKKGENLKISVLDSYSEKSLKTLTQITLNPSLIAAQKHKFSKNKSNPSPVFTVFDEGTGEHDILRDENGNLSHSEDAYVHFSNKYLRRDTPVFSISRTDYRELKSGGWEDNQIRNFVLNEIKGEFVPEVNWEQTEDNEKIEGLIYRGVIVKDSVISKNIETFKRMREIWEDEKLSKSF
jgi:hypothetical protein